MSKLGLVIDEPLLASMREPGPCEMCGYWFKDRQVHHVFEKGARSWKRIDLPWNLISLGPMLGPLCRCHSRYHHGVLSRSAILVVVANREKVTPQQIRDEHARMLRECGKGGRIEA